MVCISKQIASYVIYTNMQSSLPITKKTKLSDLINYRLKISTVDNKNYIGKLLAFDKYLNLVLADTEETRITKKSYQELKQNKSGPVVEDKRLLGLIILRGEQIVSLTIESGPTIDNKKRLGILTKGKGISKPLKVPVSQINKLQGPAKAAFKR